MDAPNTDSTTADVHPNTSGEAPGVENPGLESRDPDGLDFATTDFFERAQELGKARNEVKELRASLTSSRFELEAAKAGAQIDGILPYLNMSVFVTEDGNPDVEKMQDFIASLGATSKKPAFTQDVYAGGRGSGGGPNLRRPESFRGMTPAQIAAYAKGKF
ncbi:hypothetical protein [Streptosporangium pseudovulgare]|uniref:Scaffolding protein n=1 Tax=Streptosporangium pseudovulgare TaxID=35765 RepID=A0ABQ2QLL6_9ACTN|nr:hypothetical protein [Streptosporangium pseudovulgare]GGP84468.1 hypothetical protein GCM10010140_11970 [Streptosporangium pseudovulgare]